MSPKKINTPSFKNTQRNNVNFTQYFNPNVK